MGMNADNAMNRKEQSVNLDQAGQQRELYGKLILLWVSFLEIRGCTGCLSGPPGSGLNIKSETHDVRRVTYRL